ncbi:MAG TPA: hypothetical protein VMD53_02960 [Rhizomicrobium sp.]|nr:hypothetical protein [Rhizomicrobium sp.]
MRSAPTLFIIATACALGACTYEGPPPGYYGGYGPGPYGPAAYDDPCVNNPAYCNYAYYEGPLWWDGTWYNGPHRWREWDGGREFWVHGGWHDGVRVGEGGRWHGPGRWYQG